MIVLGRSRSTSTSAVDSDAPNLKVYRFSSLKVATNNFSSENKLGEGGFGPVYKVTFGTCSKYNSMLRERGLILV